MHSTRCDLTGSGGCGVQVGKEVKDACGPHFFDWEEAQAGLRAPVQDQAEADRKHDLVLEHGQGQKK